MKEFQYSTGIIIKDKIKKLNSWKDKVFHIKDNSGNIVKECLVFDSTLSNELEYIQKLCRDLIKKSIQDSIDRLNKEFDEL